MSSATASEHDTQPQADEEGFQRSVPIPTAKFAMWLFLATEIMFFTGLIGSYIVLRFGTKHWPSPTSVAVTLKDGTVVSGEPGTNTAEKIDLVTEEGEKKSFTANEAVVDKHSGKLGKPESPLNIPLTAMNTFILICSSVTMVRALAAGQAGDKKGMIKFLLATVLIGSCFLGVQVYEYQTLAIDEHFVPSTSIFASCFYVMTGCHGAHVTGGVVYLALVLIGAIRGKYDHNQMGVEIAGLYWHFVDLVWILLFTVVYLM